MIRQPNEAPIDMWNMPWQHLRKAIEEVAVRGRFRAEAQHRSHLKGIQEIDTHILRSCIGRLGRAERNIIAHVATGGAWGDDKLAEIGRSDGMCRHCGQQKAGVDHIYWDCSIVNRHRKLRTVGALLADKLPQCLRRGVPSAMTGGLACSFWGASLFDMGTQDGDILEAVGLGRTKHRRNVQEAQECARDSIRQDIGAKGDTLNARQTFQLAKADQAPTVLPLPKKQENPAPEKINAYTDGSWINPLRQFLGLGGAGVFWPGRKELLSDAEEQMAYAEDHHSGLKLYTALGGFGGSSTRTELAAGILAISSDVPVHIGTDSAAFQRKANKLLSWLRGGRRARADWRMQSDGDLWEHFYKAAAAKGAGAIEISKVKGHATDEHVRAGTVCQDDKEGNDQADAAADAGVLVHGKSLIELASWYHTRHQKYTDLVHDVHKHIIEAHMIHRALLRRQEHKDANKPPPARRFGPSSSSPWTAAIPSRYLHVTSSLSRYADICKGHPAAQHCEQFLRGLVVQQDSPGSRCVTWVELYALYRMSGYPKPLPDSRDKAATKSALCRQLRAFKRELKIAVDRIFLDSDDRILFRPAPQIVQPLADLGIEGFLAMLRLKPALTSHAAEVLNVHLMALGHRLGKENATAYLRGDYSVAPRKLKLKGHAKWDDGIKRHFTIFDTSQVPADPCRREAEHSAEVHLPSGSLCFFHCPNCPGVEPASSPQFQINNIATMIKCTRCHQRSAVSHWRCECGVRWHRCCRHQTAPEVLWKSARPPPAERGQASKRRQAPQATSEEPRPKRPRGEFITLSGQVADFSHFSHLLSTRLKERFGL